ncbi:MFS transporter [Microlunatus endophyticus]|uniref:MFS transporter n=1 Tax=Microlunatus endophyticus TaxID=1716077 RepID=A0A917W5T3_9ACTN|nr:MFS transporter [Microlunatus endophyticus]GGL66701.1 MFS transporter [Microlunatus endophyticus]
MSAHPSSTKITDEPFSWRFTTPLFMGSALNPINSSLIATALVAIAAGVQVSVGQTAVLVSALYVATAIAQPTAGKAAEVFGPRRVFLTGILLVLAGGLVGGFAPNLIMLLISRVLIGLGTSCAYPTAMLLIRGRAEAVGMEKPPGGVLGGLQIAGIATASLGLPIGGVLVQLLGWRSVFFINVPVAIIALIATLLWIPRDQPSTKRRGAAEVASALDLTGILGFAAAMTLLLFFLSSLPQLNLVYLVATVVLWVALVLWERRARNPFFDVRLLASNLALTRTYVRFAVVMLCGYIVLYGITQWLEAARGMSELDAGLLLLPMTLVSGIVVIPISRRNLISRPLLLSAVACIVAGVAVLFLHTGAWLVLTLIITIVIGIAQGAGISSNQTALYTAVSQAQLGTASGLLRSFGYLGSIASSAVIGIVFKQHVTNSGVGVIGWVMLAVSVVLLLITVLDRTLPRSANA